MKRRPACHGLGPFPSPMTSDDSLSLILRRLDEIERKLNRILEELHSVRRGSFPRKD